MGNRGSGIACEMAISQQQSAQTELDGSRLKEQIPRLSAMVFHKPIR